MESFTNYNKQTGGRNWSSSSVLHVKPIETNTRKLAEIATASHAANKTGKTSGILGKLFGGIFGSGGGGVGGFFSNIFSSGAKMTGFGSILGAVGGFLSGLDDTQDKLLARKLDIEEKLGMEQIKINKMKAEDSIRQTGLSSTYMGWTPKQADVPGVFEGTPGLVVGDAPTEVASNNAGIIGGSNQGMITKAQQRPV